MHRTSPRWGRRDRIYGDVFSLYDLRGIHQPGLAGFAAGRGVARHAARAGRTAGQCGRAFNDRGGRHGGGQPFGGQDAAPLRHRPCNAGKCDNDGLRTAGLCACAGLLVACAGGGANGPGRGRGGRRAEQLCGAALRGAPHELAALLLGRGSYIGACYPIAVPGREAWLARRLRRGVCHPVLSGGGAGRHAAHVGQI